MWLRDAFLGISLVTLVAWAPSAGMAAEPHPTTEENNVPEMGLEDLLQVTVYGASKFQQPLSEAPSSVSIVTADEIKKYGYRTLGDILQSLRSFLITYDRNYSYSDVRGFGRTGDYSTRVLILIDGHRINDNIFDSGFYGYDFPLDVDLIERVELIRGPGSSLYGNNAFFATVNVLTRRGRELKGGEVAGAGGSMETFDGRLSYGNRYRSGLEVLLSGSAHTSEGNGALYYPEFDQRLNPQNPRAADDGVANDLDYERAQSFFGRFSLLDFTLEGLYGNRKKGIPTAPFEVAAFDVDTYTVDRRGFLDLKYEHPFPQVGVMTRLYYDHYDYYSPMPYNAAAPGEPQLLVVNRDSATNDWLGTELQFTKTLLDEHRVIAGVEFVQNLVQAFEDHDVDPYFQGVNVDEPANRVGIYLQDEYTILGNLILNAGLRYDHYSTFGDTVSPRATLIYKPLRDTTIKLIYGEAFRAPNHYEIYYYYPGTQKGNSSLEPEKIRTYEAVIE